jgi:hypothetical protein
VNAPKALADFPVMVAIKFRTKIDNINLPYKVQGVHFMYFNRTLCPDLFLSKVYKKTKWEQIEIELSTANVQSTKVS